MIFLLVMINQMIRILFYILPVLVCSFSFGQDFPERSKPPKLVNDFANILGDREELILEKKLVAYNNSSSTQIAVVTINSIVLFLKSNDHINSTANGIIRQFWHSFDF